MFIRRVQKPKGPEKKRRRKKKRGQTPFRKSAALKSELLPPDPIECLDAPAPPVLRAQSQRLQKICGSREGLQFHHVTYEWLGREIDCDLVPLCEDRPSILYTIIGSSAPDMTTDTDLLIAAAKFDEEAASVMKHAAA